MRLILVCTFIIIIIWQTDRSQKDGSYPHMTNGDGSIIVLTRRTNPLVRKELNPFFTNSIPQRDKERKASKGWIVNQLFYYHLSVSGML